jgi:hypothetical protein|nr:MAG TPA: hypothetical protein [Caudoviricetes sp.]
MAEWINDPQGREEIEKVTKELKLPVWKANHKGKFRDFWNELWDKIEDYILKLKGDTEKNSKGLNDRLISAVGKHDGDFPIANAVVGNVYYSELTKKYYKCKVGGPAPMPNGNFIDMSILENLNRLENLSKYKEEVVTRISNKNTEATFTLIALGHIRIISFTNINVHNSYETIFPNIPSWFCQNTKYMLFSCANGSGGYGGEVSECHFDPANRMLKFYPNTMNGSKEIELTGQCISVSLETI